MGNEEAAPKTKGVTTELLASVDLGPEIEGKERSPTIEMESLRGIGLEWAGPRIGTPHTGSRTEEHSGGGDLGRHCQARISPTSTCKSAGAHGREERSVGKRLRMFPEQSPCHCLACQRRTGSVFGVQARFDAEQVTTEGAARQYIRVSDEGENRAFFHFCPDCGATVFYTTEATLGIVAVPVGAFADPFFPASTRSIWEERRHSWLRLPDDIEHVS
jgi:hypothetical protein